MEKSTPVHRWEQQVLFPTEVVEITARIGIMAGSDHVQFQVESSDPTSGNTLSMWSCPHVSCAGSERLYGEFLAHLEELWRSHALPF